MTMIRTMTGVALLAVAASLSPQPVSAQEGVIGGALFGGAAGAIIGAAAGGRGGAAAGAIIGAATGAALGAQMERRRTGYYWYNGRCWQRDSRGNYHLVSRRYC